MLDGRKVAILVAEGFEQSEMVEPRKALEQAGAQTVLVSPAQGEVQGWKHFDKADRFNVDVPIDQANPGDPGASRTPTSFAPTQARCSSSSASSKPASRSE